MQKPQSPGVVFLDFQAFALPNSVCNLVHTSLHSHLCTSVGDIPRSVVMQDQSACAFEMFRNLVKLPSASLLARPELQGS